MACQCVGDGGAVDCAVPGEAVAGGGKSVAIDEWNDAEVEGDGAVAAC